MGGWLVGWLIGGGGGSGGVGGSGGGGGIVEVRRSKTEEGVNRIFISAHSIIIIIISTSDASYRYQQSEM